MLTVGSTIDISTIELQGIAVGLEPIEENEFFAWRQSVIEETSTFNIPSNIVPLPDKVSAWYDGSVDGEKCLVSLSEQDLYIIATTKNFGHALCHWVSQKDGIYRASSTLPIRPINTTNERNVKIMSSMLQAAAKHSATRRRATQMNINNAPETEEGQDIAYNASGMTSVDPLVVQKTAQAYGYVFGYISPNAPQTTMRRVVTKKSDDTKDAHIEARQSKPSRPSHVMLSLPKKCCVRGGVLATPQDIQSVNIDWDSASDENIYVTMNLSAATAYIFAFGGKIPEYAPNVSDAQSQWTPDQIMENDPSVTFVHVTASVLRDNSRKFNYNLKTTSARRTLFTKNNHVCLRACEHMDIPETLTEEKAYELNNSAFGHLAYRKSSDKKTSLLTQLMCDCPSQIWEKKYTINGEAKDGIGSCFFMAGDSEEVNGSPVPRTPVEYVPWFEPSTKNGAPKSKCKAIVARKLKTTKSGGTTMAATRIDYKDNQNHAMFKPYKGFVDAAIENKYISREKLESMCSTTSRKSRNYVMPANALKEFSTFLKEEKVDAGINEAIMAVTNRLMLENN